MKNRRISIFITVILILMFLFSSCSSKKSESAISNGEYEYDSVAPSEPQYNEKAPDYNPAAADGGFYDREAEETGKGYDDYDESPLTPTLPSDRKIIQTLNLKIETLEFDTSVQRINDLVEAHEGFIQSSNISGKSIEKTATRYAYFTLRIPSEKLEAFKIGADGIGNILNSETTGQDVTEAYIDNEARLGVLEIEEERLLAILQKAETVPDIIELERRLSQIRSEIEALTGTLRKYDSLVSLSTVMISLQEVLIFTPDVPITFTEEIKDSFDGSIEGIKAFFEGLVLLFAALVPVLVVFGIPLFVILVLLRLKHIKRKKVEIKVQDNSKEE